MNILGTIIKSAASQFGREFGRAGANKVLKGSNHYTIKNSEPIDYNSRRKPSDSELTSFIKEFKKLEYGVRIPNNIVKLLHKLENMKKFMDNNSLENLSEIKVLIEIYNNKINLLYDLIDEDFNSKELELLKKKESEVDDLISSIEENAALYLKSKYKFSKKQKLSKRKFLLSFLPFIGFHKFYVKEYKKGIINLLLSLLLSPAFIMLFIVSDGHSTPIGLFLFYGAPIFVNIIYFILALFMSEDKFDYKYNDDYVKYRALMLLNGFEDEL